MTTGVRNAVGYGLLTPSEGVLVARLAQGVARRDLARGESTDDEVELLLAWARIRLRAHDDADLVARWHRLEAFAAAAEALPAGQP
jgi:hypothetical protein